MQGLQHLQLMQHQKEPIKKINLKSIKDTDFTDRIEKEVNQILNKIKDMTREVRKLVLEKLSKQIIII